MTADPVTDLLALAAKQRNAFRSSQAQALGWTESAVAVAKKSTWTKLSRGVYVHTFVWEVLSPQERHLCLAMARVLAGRTGWHTARRTAALAHELPMIGSHPNVPQLVRNPSQRTRAVNRHERLAELPAGDTSVLAGLPATALARTVVDVSRAEPMINSVVMADAALRAGLSAPELKATAARYASWPGGLTAVRVAAFPNGLSESPLESMSRVRFLELRLPAPELQILVFLGEELLARLDFLWRHRNAVGLADGAIKYSSRDDVIAEKWQVERLEDVGLEVARWGWDVAYRRPEELDYKVRRALDRGGRQVLDPRVRFVTTTVEQNVRANARAVGRRAG